MVHCMWSGNMEAVVRTATSDRLEPSRTDLSAGQSLENSWEIYISDADWRCLPEYKVYKV